MITFRITQAEWPLLEDRIHAIPHRQGEAEPALFPDGAPLAIGEMAAPAAPGLQALVWSSQC